MRPREADKRAPAEGECSPLQGELLGVCSLKAEQLLQVLEEESSVLRAFQTEQLLPVLSRKEALTLELGESVGELARLKALNGAAADSPAYKRLAERLKEIKQKNRSNQVFVEGSLLYLQDLLKCLRPSTYLPGRGGGPQAAAIAVKGLALRKEA